MLLAVGIFLACLLAILAIPVNLVFTIHRHESSQWRVDLCWLFGLIRIPLPSHRTTRKVRKRPPAKKRKMPFLFGGRGRFMPVLKSKGFMKRIVRLLKDLSKTVHVHRLGVRARLGLDDPADTGRLWGMAGPLAALLSHSRSVHVHLEPEFTAETFDLDGEGHLRIIPLQIIFVILTFLISPATLRAVKVMVVSGCK